MAKNLSIVANGISGDAGHLLGYNVTDNGIYTPAIGDVARDTTATYVAQDGTIKTAQENVARVDYTNGVAELLLEPTSTNLITYSRDFSDSSWEQTNSIITQQGDEYLLSDDNSGGSGTVALNKFSFNLGSSGTYTYSIFVKQVANKFIQLTSAGYDSSGVGNSVFDIENGQITQESTNHIAEIKKYPNGYYRLSITFTSTIDLVGALNLYILNENEETTNTLDGTNQVIIANAQVEPLPYATSYIPTNGAIATRGADSLTNFGSEQIIDSESGILFFEGSAFPSSIPTQITLNDGSPNARMGLRFQEVSNIITAIQRKDGASVVANYDLGSEDNLKNNIKLAVRYSGSLIEIIFSGVAQNSNTISQFTSASLSNLSFNDGGENSTIFYGRVRQLKHLPYNTDITTL